MRFPLAARLPPLGHLRPSRNQLPSAAARAGWDPREETDIPYATSYVATSVLLPRECRRSRHIQQHIPSSARNVGHVRVRHQRLHNGLARLNLPERNEPISGLVQRTRNCRRRFGLSLGADDCRLTLLLGL